MQDELLQKIAADLGIADLPVAEQKHLVADFGEVALKAATTAVFAKLPEGKRDEFVKLAKSGDAAAVQAFLDREVPGHETVAKDAVAEEVRRFKEKAAK